ncbi:MAG TPA: flagellar motor switch protein FliG [Bryobacteraceae bacterium]|nr:flagellar motor switch protein FliG [Bryobacteraceae bacterium]
MPLALSASPVPQKAQLTLKGVQKAAILMVILKEEASAEVLKQMDDAEVQRIGREIAKIPAITSEMAETVLSEFYEMIVAQDYVLKGGIDYARKILTTAFGPEHAKRLIDRVAKALSTDSSNFDALQKADPQQLANFIQNEHPQTIALILSHLGPTHAAKLLYYLDIDRRADIALRMASLDQISPEIIAKIATVIGEKLKSLGENNRETFGGVHAVADMFNRLDQNDGKAILEVMNESDPELCDSIRNLMFVFEDLLKVDQAAIRELLARVDRKVVAIALKGTSDTLKSHFLDVMSKRAAEMMREDIDALGPVKLREVERAQQEMISTVRQLEAEGVVSLAETGGDEYVN